MAAMAKGSKPVQKMLLVLLAVIFALSFQGADEASAGEDVLKPVPEEIRYEATLPNNSDVGRPLPLAGHWNRGLVSDGFSPSYQMTMIEKGHYLLPWFHLREPGQTIDLKYYEGPIKKAAELKLPISFISTQWERVLTSDQKYFTLPAEQNPNVVDINGNVLTKVCPFGPTEPWHEVGLGWTSHSILKQLQEWYPAPPLVIFVSNNEHSKLRWHEVENSKRYMDKYGSGKDDNFKREVVGDGWITRYRELQKGMIDGLIAQTWKDKTRFVGYEAFGGGAFARWDGWINYSLYKPSRMEPWPLAWDGGSVSYYVFDWDPTTDFRVWSPQVQAMNWIFMQENARNFNPDFWFEMSTWDGYEPSKDSDKRAYYASLGQSYNPTRYGGMVQFGMWLLRPRLVREFRHHTDTLESAEPYFLPIVEAVDRVHNNPMLRKFWRKGELVASAARSHPYQSNVPDEYKAINRWYLLDTSLDPKWPWDLYTEVPVYSLALVLGQAPEREWLVYAYAPLGEKKDVEVTLPGYGQIKIDATPAGVFYSVIEKTKQTTKITSDSQDIPPPSNLRINATE